LSIHSGEMLIQTRAGGGYATSVEYLFSISPPCLAEDPELRLVRGEAKHDEIGVEAVE